MRDLFAERLAYDLRLDERVLDYVVEEASRDRHFVEPHLGEYIGDFERVDEVRLAGGARLPLVLARREEVGAAEHVEVGLRVIARDLLDDLFDANHKKAVSD